MRRWGETHLYCGVNFNAYDTKTAGHIGKYDFARLFRYGSDGTRNAQRKKRIIEILESTYKKPIDELPQYQIVKSGAVIYSHPFRKAVVDGYSQDFDVRDEYEKEYRELRNLTYSRAHHVYGNFSELPESKKRELIDIATMNLFNQNFDLYEQLNLDSETGWFGTAGEKDFEEEDEF